MALAVLIFREGFDSGIVKTCDELDLSRWRRSPWMEVVGKPSLDKMHAKKSAFFLVSTKTKVRSVPTSLRVSMSVSLFLNFSTWRYDTQVLSDNNKELKSPYDVPYFRSKNSVYFVKFEVSTISNKKSFPGNTVQGFPG